MERYYRRDLVDFYRGRMSIRKLCVLVSELPCESRTRRSVDGVDPWTRTDYLLSDLWVLAARQLTPDAPKRHPWREEEDQRQDRPRQDARRAKLEAAAHRRRASRQPAV